MPLKKARRIPKLRQAGHGPIEEYCDSMEVSLCEWRAMKRLERAARTLAYNPIEYAVANLDAVRRMCE